MIDNFMCFSVFIINGKKIFVSVVHYNGETKRVEGSDALKVGVTSLMPETLIKHMADPPSPAAESLLKFHGDVWVQYANIKGCMIYFDKISNDVIDDPETLANKLPGVLEESKCPVSGQKGRIKDIIIKLNDRDKWPREKIAEWLETLDVDLEFK